MGSKERGKEGVWKRNIIIIIMLVWKVVVMLLASQLQIALNYIEHYYAFLGEPP